MPSIQGTDIWHGDSTPILLHEWTPSSNIKYLINPGARIEARNGQNDQ